MRVLLWSQVWPRRLPPCWLPVQPVFGLGYHGASSKWLRHPKLRPIQGSVPILSNSGPPFIGCRRQWKDSALWIVQCRYSCCRPSPCRHWCCRNRCRCRYWAWIRCRGWFPCRDHRRGVLLPWWEPCCAWWEQWSRCSGWLWYRWFSYPRCGGVQSKY